MSTAMMWANLIFWICWLALCVYMLGFRMKLNKRVCNDWSVKKAIFFLHWEPRLILFALGFMAVFMLYQFFVVTLPHLLARF